MILPTEVWEASGHLAEFVDPLTECQSCHKRFRADHLRGGLRGASTDAADVELTEIACPNCGNKGTFTEPRMFNGLLKTYLGPVEDEEGLHYLRPETAQGIFINFANVMTTAAQEAAVRHRPDRQELPQRDHPGQLHLPHPRVRADGDGVLRRAGHGRGVARVLAEDALGLVHRPRSQPGRTCATTSTRRRSCRTTRSAPSTSSTGSSFGGTEFAELEGIANRTDFDLTTHSKHSGVDLSYFDQEKGERWTPYVIEPAAGLTRAVLAFLLDAYTEDEAPNAKGGVDKRTVLRFDPRLAPVKAAVLPLSRNADLSPKARDLADRAAQELERRVRRRAARSAAGTAARTRSARRSASPSTSTRSTTRR